MLKRKRRPVLLDCSLIPSKTQQHFRDDANINLIMKKFVRTGILGSPDGASRMPRFGDFSNIDYQKSMEIVASAKSGFEGLPSDIRALFENDVQQMLDFIADPDNKDDAIELGLLAKDPVDLPLSSDVLPAAPAASPDVIVADVPATDPIVEP